MVVAPGGDAFGRGMSRAPDVPRGIARPAFEFSFTFTSIRHPCQVGARLPRVGCMPEGEARSGDEGDGFLRRARGIARRWRPLSLGPWYIEGEEWPLMYVDPAVASKERS